MRYLPRVLPGTVLPGTVLPGTVLPGTVLPGTTHARPSHTHSPIPSLIPTPTYVSQTKRPAPPPFHAACGRPLSRRGSAPSQTPRSTSL